MFFCTQGEIKIAAFNSEADKYFPLVEQGKVSAALPSSGNIT